MRMDHGDWGWVCNCGATIPCGPAGPHAHDAINVHAAQHRQEVTQTGPGGWGHGPFPSEIIPGSDFPPEMAYEMRLTNLQTGEVDPHQTWGVENPAYAALRWHGGTPYRIEPQHDDDSLPVLARIDRAIKDVERALELVAECQPPLAADTLPEVFRRRLAQAINRLCSANRDVARLQDELLITHAAYDADCLRQRRYGAFEAEPMFHLNADGGRYFSARGRSFSGPLTIQEHLRRYSIALGEASKEAAMALLADESEMRQDPTESTGGTEYDTHLFGAASFSYEEEGDDLETVRAIVAPDAPPLRVSVYVTQCHDDCHRAVGQLQETGIAYSVLQTRLSRADRRTPQGGLTQYEIIVRREDEQAAKTALGRD